MTRRMFAVNFQVVFLLCSVLLVPCITQSQEMQGIDKIVEQQKGTITLPETGQTGNYGINDDGALKKGASWPNPRFTDNNNGTITDNLTGLMWTKDARNPGPLECPIDTSKNWKDALAHVSCLNQNKYLGYNDWRMPNINELASLVNTDNADSTVWLTAQGFRNVIMEFYWTSTTDAQRTKLAWVGVLYSGNLFSRKKGKEYPVWPVRGGDDSSSGVIKLPETGQGTCYGKKKSKKSDPCGGSGEDGEYKAGVAWPNPRFQPEGDCVTDRLTGLTWVKIPYDNETWADAMEFVNKLSLGDTMTGDCRIEMS